MNPMAKMPGFEAMQAQQEAFMKAMTGAWSGATSPEAETSEQDEASDAGGEQLDEIKQQLAELQAKLSKLGK